MYDDDVEFLELLLDHAVAAQEEENEAKQQKRLNGELEPPVSFVFFGGGGKGVGYNGIHVFSRYERACGSVTQQPRQYHERPVQSNPWTSLGRNGRPSSRCECLKRRTCRIVQEISGGTAIRWYCYLQQWQMPRDVRSKNPPFPKARGVSLLFSFFAITNIGAALLTNMLYMGNGV